LTLPPALLPYPHLPVYAFAPEAKSGLWHQAQATVIAGRSGKSSELLLTHSKGENKGVVKKLSK